MQAYGNSISAIVLDISKPLDSFENSVTALRHLCSQLFHRGAKALIIGGDFQLELQPSFLDVTGPYALGRPSKHDYWDRHSLLVDLMCTFGLHAANTFNNQELPQTRIPWGKCRKDGTQIDYFLVSSSLQGSCAASGKRIFRSDHVSIWGA